MTRLQYEELKSYQQAGQLSPTEELLLNEYDRLTETIRKLVDRSSGSQGLRGDYMDVFEIASEALEFK